MTNGGTWGRGRQGGGAPPIKPMTEGHPPGLRPHNVALSALPAHPLGGELGHAAPARRGRQEGGPPLMKPMTEEHLAVLRRHMVELIALHADLLEEELGKAALDGRVLQAMRRVPRHLFVPAPLAALAYEDAPLPIGFDKTISQPLMCALMADLLAPGPGEAVLEVGTGLGYQTALLAELAGRGWSVEIGRSGEGGG